MATVINEDELKRFVEEKSIIKNGDVKCAEGIKYDFRLGNKFMKAGENSIQSFDELKNKNKALIEPGEVVFVQTEESLEIPKDMYVMLSEKRKMSHDGIGLLGGRVVDPCYKGRLFFGLHNISNSRFYLKEGYKLVGATFYRLADNETVEPSTVPESWEDFPVDLASFINKFQSLTPTVNERLDTLTKDLGDLKKLIKMLLIPTFIAVIAGLVLNFLS